jgi:hypothetical protein
VNCTSGVVLVATVPFPVRVGVVTTVGFGVLAEELLAVVVAAEEEGAVVAEMVAEGVSEIRGTVRENAVAQLARSMPCG